MDLTRPASQLLGSNRTKVLQRLAVLADGASGRAIHALAGVGSLATTQRLLEELDEIGLVDVRPVGAANLYSLNRDHVLWPIVEQLLGASALTEQRIAEVLDDVLGDDAEASLLYGSFARQEAGPGSDVDVFVVWKTEIDEERATGLLDEAAVRVRRLTGNDAQLIAVTPAELAGLVHRADPLIGSLRRDGRSLTAGVKPSDLVGRS